MTARLFAFVIWAALAASVIAWGLRLGAGSRPVPSHAVVVSDSGSSGADLTRLLGSDTVATVAAPTTPSSTRLKLLGVVAARAEAATYSGLALIAIDGKPARPYRVGGLVEEDLVLLEVRARSASLGPASGPASMKLEVPPLVAAATGTRPAAINGALPGQTGLPLRMPQSLPPPPPPEPMPQEMIEEVEPMQLPEVPNEPEPEYDNSSPEMIEEQPQQAPTSPAFGRRGPAN